ncbi:MAG: UDP-glucose/GDP-mannose dehydrogenase family protein [Actinobacteria bacterium]|nr:UDP-glucose/GDP-mannose dehydrogenase family protein [Actinomycetota bacterium]
MNICVIGTGYVGLVTGVCLAEIENNVICVDNIKEKINKLASGESTIYEPGIEELLKKNIKNNRLSFTTDISKAINRSEVIYICVGTPSLFNGQANLKFIEDVATEIGKYINGNKIIVNKSTVPIGSGDWVSMVISESIERNNPVKDIDFHVVSNPEFLREGSAISDTLFPDRIVIGSSSKEVVDKMTELYKPIIDQSFDCPKGIERLIPKGKKIPVVKSDLTSAEMIKYAANSFLATKVSFINEIANICEKVGADILKVSEGMGLDRRIAPEFLNAGIGWGGSCFPKDIQALSYIAGEYGIIPQILNSVINVNTGQRQKIVKKVQDELKIVKGKTIAILGISFKPDTDDVRESPSIDIMNNLAALGARIKFYDPIVKVKPEALDKKVLICNDAYTAAADSELLLLATEWKEFLKLDFIKIKELMSKPIIIDGRNFLDRDYLEKKGFKYIGIGR